MSFQDALPPARSEGESKLPLWMLNQLDAARAGFDQIGNRLPPDHARGIIEWYEGMAKTLASTLP